VDSVLPSGEKATPVTTEVCPWRVATLSLIATFQNFTVPSALTEARILPSGENVTLSTTPVCPRSVATSRRDDLVATAAAYGLLSERSRHVGQRHVGLPTDHPDVTGSAPAI
jgi:hypothetical protein